MGQHLLTSYKGPSNGTWTIKLRIDGEGGGGEWGGGMAFLKED